jgi:hypothetical protein
MTNKTQDRRTSISKVVVFDSPSSEGKTVPVPQITYHGAGFKFLVLSNKITQHNWHYFSQKK